MQRNEINLLEFPDELLLQIFCNLNDTALLNATRVCYRFKSIAKDAFAQKYSGTSDDKYYRIKVFCESLVEEQKQYLSIFCTFGEEMCAINITFCTELHHNDVTKNHWLFRLIHRYCSSIRKTIIEDGKKVDLTNFIDLMPKLSHLELKKLTLLNQKWTDRSYPKLIHFSATNVRELDDEDFSNFINHNQQLEHLSMIECLKDTMNVLNAVNNKLKQLKSLEVITEKTNFTSNTNSFVFDSLKSLTVTTNSNSFVPVLTSIRNGCNNIESLQIIDYSHDKLHAREINLICSFDILKTLDMYSFTISFELLKHLIQHLPKLVSFSLSYAENLCGTNDDLLSVVLICQKLSLVQLSVIVSLPKLNYEFYTRFSDIMQSTGSNLKLKLFCYDEEIVLTQNEARYIDESCNHSLSHSILYWDGYDATYAQSNKNLLELNENILTHIIDFLDGNALHALYQTCKLTKQLVKKHLSQNVFYSPLCPTKTFIDENVYRNLGENILRIHIDLDYYLGVENTDDETAYLSKVMKCLKNVNKYCGKNLIEMRIRHNIVCETLLTWPNLKKLHFSSSINNQTLRLFCCPELTHLIISYYTKDIVNVPFDCADSFRNLTSLKLNYNEDVEHFLSNLNPMICGQLKDLSLNCWSLYDIKWIEANQRQCWINLINIIIRFRHLSTLYLHVDGIEKSNYQYLFENSSMLVKFSIYCSNWSILCGHNFEMLRQIKLNCKQIELIQLIGKCSAFTPSFLQKIYNVFPKTKINLIYINKPGYYNLL